MTIHDIRGCEWLADPDTCGLYLNLCVIGDIETSLDDLADTCNISVRSLRNGLKQLAVDGLITVTSTETSTIVELCKETENNDVLPKSDNKVETPKVVVNKEADYHAQLMNSQQFTTMAAKNFLTTPNDVLAAINVFHSEQEAKGARHPNYSEYRKHAYNWLRIYFNNRQHNKQYGTSQQERNDRYQQEMAAFCAAKLAGAGR